MQAHTVRVLAERIRRTNANLRSMWEEHAEDPEDLKAAILESIR